MKEQFLKFISDHKLFDKKDKVLLTISGGIDSMTMLHLFQECSFNFAIAHCNFMLRGEESDNDQEFVQRYAQNNELILHINRFDTLNYAEKNKLSIQMAARELRYRWFDNLAKENNYTHIATGHNVNDVAETFFINLSRGTGLHGLTGINVINGNIIRPILFASRKQITEYASKQNISYREDSSNSETKYLRNAIRHEIMPQFEKLNQSFLKNIIHTTSILNDAEQVYNKSINELKQLILTTDNKLIHIDITALKTHKVSSATLYEILNPYGFSFDTAKRLLENINNQPGAQYFSETHKIIKDRTTYILFPLEKNEFEEFEINENAQFFKGPIELKIEEITIDKNFNLIRNQSIGSFDAEKLKYPLKLRHWQHGDYFYPFGMRGKKKISDYFSDQKFSIPEKENTWILESDNKVVWIVNHRTDNRFAITSSTRKVIQIEFNKLKLENGNKQ